MSDDTAKRKWWECRRATRRIRIGGHREQDGTHNVSASFESHDPFITIFVAMKGDEAREFAADLLAAADFAEGKS